MTGTADEETPLLQDTEGMGLPAPLPWFQLSIVMALQLAEPLTFHVIQPFAPQVYSSFTLTINYLLNNTSTKLMREIIHKEHGNESQVGFYVGILVSSSIWPLVEFSPC